MGKNIKQYHNTVAYLFPSQRPSFEHAGLTCYTLLSLSITFSLFHSELKTYLFRKSYPPRQSVSLSWTDLIDLDRLPDFFADQFLSFSSISFCFSYSSCVAENLNRNNSCLSTFWCML